MIYLKKGLVMRTVEEKTKREKEKMLLSAKTAEETKAALDMGASANCVDVDFGTPLLYAKTAE